MALLTGEELMARAGWGKPLLSKKWHFFRRCTSLCGKWGYAGKLEDVDEGATANDCRACRRKRDAETAPPAIPGEP